MAEVVQNNNAMHSSTNSSSSEVIYGTSGSIGSGGDDSRVMSEKVQMLASSIYKEFETMIQKHGEDSLKGLMPLVVNVLENLDLAYLEKEEYSVDLEMLKEDNEQLMTQYEREKQLRRAQDQKCLEIEDTLMEQNRELESKIESLESIMRMLELKAKNAFDHANRLEEREADQKAEFDKLHERYNVLLRTHIDHMERTKYLMGTEKFELMQSMPLPSQQLRTKLGMAASVDASTIRGVSDLISAHMSQSTTADVNLANHISGEADWQDEFGQSGTEILQSPCDEKAPVPENSHESPSLGSAEQPTTSSPATNDANFTEPGDSLGADLTGALVDPAEFASAVNDTFIGMGREVENLIKENTELLETKNALNIVKNDLIARVDELSSEQDILREEIRSLELVRTKMAERIKELEVEFREQKEKLDAKGDDDQEDVPMAQRKRFTRLEMARVLMERNSYKEKLMELQEAVKWTELQRIKRMNANHAKKSSGIWEFFSGLFSHEPPHNSTRRSRHTGFNDRDALRRSSAKTIDLIETDYTSERRAAVRRHQYRVVKEYMNRGENDRLHAYGWSVPAIASEINENNAVPVPAFCRPLLDIDPTLKIWCASGMTLKGGKTQDGQFIEDTTQAVNGVDDATLQSSPENLKQFERGFGVLNVDSCSLLWICSSNQGHSQVAILDANNPMSVIDAFPACSAHLLCVSSVPGAQVTDYPSGDSNWKSFVRGGGYVKDLPADINEHEQFGAVRWIEMRKVASVEDTTLTFCGPDEKPSPQRSRDFSICEPSPASTSGNSQGLEDATDAINPEYAAKEDAVRCSMQRGIVKRYILLEKMQDQKTKDDGPDVDNEAVRSGTSSLSDDIMSRLSKYENLDNLDVLPTMWMGSQNDYIFIHSAVKDWRKCLRRIKMPDAVLSVLHYKGRVFAALANGSIAVFHRDASSSWSEMGYHCITVGRATSSVRSLSMVRNLLWAAYRSCIIVLDPENLTVKKVFAAHPRRDSQVRHMQWIGDGVWISIRLDSTLRLYHAYTYDHLQDVDIEPYVTKMLGTSSLDFSFMRTTALLVTCQRLWIGTGTGVIISIPLEENESRITTKLNAPNSSEELRGPGGLIRVYGDSREQPSNGGFIPYCDMSRAQLSFHGHKDSVKFFLAVPGSRKESTFSPTIERLENDEIATSDGEVKNCGSVAVKGTARKDESSRVLVVSGGDGYIDFRVGEDEEPMDVTSAIRAQDMSHLIVWEVAVSVSKMH